MSEHMTAHGDGQHEYVMIQGWEYPFGEEPQWRDLQPLAGWPGTHHVEAVFEVWREQWGYSRIRAVPIQPTQLDRLDGFPPPRWLRPMAPRPRPTRRPGSRELARRHPLLSWARSLPDSGRITYIPWWRAKGEE